MIFATYGETVINAVAGVGVVVANGTAEDPRDYAEKVAHRFFPNILPYTVGTTAGFGFAEWNGRSLTDNAPNIMFSIASNTPIRPSRHRQGVGDLKTVKEVPLRSCCLLESGGALATSVAPLQVITKKILADRLRSDSFRRKPAEVICKLTLRLKHWGATCLSLMR
jgi:hypothetical protein